MTGGRGLSGSDLRPSPLSQSAGRGGGASRGRPQGSEWRHRFLCRPARRGAGNPDRCLPREGPLKPLGLKIETRRQAAGGGGSGYLRTRGRRERRAADALLGFSQAHDEGRACSCLCRSLSPSEHAGFRCLAAAL